MLGLHPTGHREHWSGALSSFGDQELVGSVRLQFYRARTSPRAVCAQNSSD